MAWRGPEPELRSSATRSVHAPRARSNSIRAFFASSRTL